MPTNPFCSECPSTACTVNRIEDDAPAFCPSRAHTDVVEATVQEFCDDPELRKLAFAAARAEAEGYLRWTRLEDTIAFARNIEAKTLGIATCAGLMRESATAAKIFRQHGFKVVSVCCKVGAVDKSRIGLGPEGRVIPDRPFEASCMPLAQAEILNSCDTDLNVLIGLCVGHDALFYKRSKAPVTTLIAKDRVLGHNPAAALYTSHTYYSKLLK